MALDYLNKTKKAIINTGNILSLNDITRKSTQNATDELIEAANITLENYEKLDKFNGVNNDIVFIKRSNDDLNDKIKEQELSNLKIGLKIFLNNNDYTLIHESIKTAFQILNVSHVDSVIIAYQQKISPEKDLQSLKILWKALEELVENQQIDQIGLANIEEAQFRIIYEWAKIKPKIIQINIATCCIVPPTLQSFCKENEILLLTHSDPVDFLPKEKTKPLFKKDFNIEWILRYLIHIKCRGVLITKGYLVSLNDTNN